MERLLNLVGQGMDVHPFGEGRPLLLGGVRVSDTGGLTGHSDADVVLHAVSDALLGAVGAGDIGVLFPSEDPRWEGEDSSTFVRAALAEVKSRGGSVANIDITIVAERPRISPHRAAIRASVARLLGIAEIRVNVKATTTDGLGFTGRGEGIAALAVVSVEVLG